MKFKKIQGFWGVIISIIYASSVMAQQAPLPNVEPGLLNRNNTQIKEDKAQEYFKNPENINKEVYDFNSQKPIPAIIQKSGFILSKIEFTGNKLFSEKELEKFTKDYVGKDVSIYDIKDLMNQITNSYHNEGYITSFAYLPAQAIKNGVVKINIVESKIGDIKIAGNKWERTSFLKNNILMANGIKPGKPFNVNEIRKALGKTNENDYMKGRIILQKGENDDQVNMTFEVKDRFPFQFEAGTDNRGKDFIGENRAFLTVGNENITGYGDKLKASTYFGSRTFGLLTDYALPIGPYGTELRASYGYSRMKIGKQYSHLNIRGTAHQYSTGVFQPIYEGRTWKIDSDMMFDAITSNTNVNKVFDIDKYNVRALRIGLNAIKDDYYGRWVSRMEVSTGLPILGATKNRDKSTGTASFVSIRPSIIRVQKLPYKTTGVFRASGQFSPHHLLAYEQYQLGGLYSVRGFKQGLVYGDLGYYASLELRKNIPIPNIKYVRYLKDKVSLAAFYDQGFAKELQQENIGTNNKFLQSLGVGLRLNVNEYLNADLDLGIPLGRKITPDQDPVKFHFMINSDVI